MRIAKSYLRAHIKVIPQVLNHPIMELIDHYRPLNQRHGRTKAFIVFTAFS